MASSAHSPVSGEAEQAFSSTLEALTDERRQQVAAMRARLEGLPPGEGPAFRRHDLWLKRFLAHAKWDLEEALKLYLHTEAWRKENGADEILETAADGRLPALPIDVTLFYPYGTDSQGRQLTIMTPGLAPWWRALFEPISELCRSQIWLAEWSLAECERKAARTGQWHERAVVLVDLSFLSFRFFQGIMGSSRGRHRAQNARGHIRNYPGLIDKAYVINPPSHMGKIWIILKLLLSAALMEKAVLVSSDEEVAAMLQDLGKENVPRNLGGTSDAPTFPLPEHLRMPSDGWSVSVDAWRPRELFINARSKYEEVVSVPAGGHVSWHWTLFDHSIAFEVLSRPAGEKAFHVLVPSKELHFNDLEDPILGQVSAPAGGGEVQLVWDNTFSKLRGKTLLLRVEVFSHSEVVASSLPVSR